MSLASDGWLLGVGVFQFQPGYSTQGFCWVAVGKSYPVLETWCLQMENEAVELDQSP